MSIKLELSDSKTETCSSTIDNVGSCRSLSTSNSEVYIVDATLSTDTSVFKFRVTTTSEPATVSLQLDDDTKQFNVDAHTSEATRELEFNSEDIDTDTDNKKSTRYPTWSIIVIVLSSLIVVGLIIGLLVYAIRSNKKTDKEKLP